MDAHYIDGWTSCQFVVGYFSHWYKLPEFIMLATVFSFSMLCMEC